MANLLDLVNQLIGDVLAGNIYTNTEPYALALKTPLRAPTNAAHPHAGSNVIPPPQHGPPSMPRAAIYQQGVDKLSIPEQVTTSQQLDPVVPRDRIYNNSNSLNRIGGPLSDLLAFHESKTHPHTDGKIIPNAPPARNAEPPGYYNRSEFHPSQHGAPPNPTATPQNYDNGSTPLRTWDNMDGVKRDQIYNGPPPPDVIDQKSVSDNPSFAKGQSFDPTIRNNTYAVDYSNPNGSISNPKAIVSNIGGTPDSVATLADVKTSKGLPPTPASLKSKIDNNNIKDFQGNVSRNERLVPGKDDLFRDESFAIGGKFSPIGQRPVPPPLRVVDVFSIVHWLRNIGKELSGIGEPSAGTGNVQQNIEGLVKGGFFVASQFLLAALNPGGLGTSAIGESAPLTNLGISNAVWNPLAIPVAAFARVYNPDIAPIIAGPLFGGAYKQSLLDRLATSTDVLTTFGEGTSGADLPGAPPSLFGKIPADIAEETQRITGQFIDPLDARFPEEDEESLRTALIPEDSIYMPFMFQDLRDTPEKFLYFRAFLKEGLSETFTPDWQIERYYGRVDQIPIYVGTTRDINVAFDVVAWKPEDLPVIYRKLQKLQSMVYPHYDEKGFLKAGPIIRMRIGDLIAGFNNKGIPGYITSLNLDYDDGIWNIKEDAKVPRKISVSLSYTVLHDGNPGIYPYTEANITQDGTVNVTGENVKTFGAGTFFTSQNGATSVTVTPSDIRKIFKQVRKGGI